MNVGAAATVAWQGLTTVHSYGRVPAKWRMSASACYRRVVPTGQEEAHLLPWATAYKESWRQLRSGPRRTGGGPVCSRQPAQTPGGGVAAPGRS